VAECGGAFGAAAFCGGTTATGLEGVGGGAFSGLGGVSPFIVAFSLPASVALRSAPAGRSLFLERTYAGRGSRARQRGTRLPGRHDTLAGELARLGGRGNRWKAVILGREQSLVGNCRPLILGLRR
jgi:hypothetical protein